MRSAYTQAVKARTVPWAPSTGSRRWRCDPRKAEAGFFEVTVPEAEPAMLYRKKSPYNYVRVVEVSMLHACRRMQQNSHQIKNAIAGPHSVLWVSGRQCR